MEFDLSKNRRIALGAAVLAAPFVLAAPSPAQAHGTCLELPGRGAGCVSTSHTSVSACDGAADGWGVRTWYRTSNNVTDHVGDPDGSGGSCGSESPLGGGTITSYRVCAGPNNTDSECTQWVTA
ncbi:hypothetical protein GCM10010429_40980 [Micromonospora olivasterospora]